MPGAPPPPEGGNHATTKVFWVVVLGDFGRSPRMQYHAQSLAAKPHTEVHIVAYGGSAPLASLASAPNVHFATLPEVPGLIQRVPFLPGILRLALKAMHQLLALLWLLLWRLPAPRAILMQNPPAIPSMMICCLAAWRHAAALVIDWHNFAFSIMALKLPADGVVVRMARLHESAWGRMARHHFCVTQAMKDELTSVAGKDRARKDRKNKGSHEGNDSEGGIWRLPPSAVTVLYDRPPSHFKKTDVGAAHDLLVRLAPALARQVLPGEAPGKGGPDPPPPLAALDFVAAEVESWRPDRTIATCIDTSIDPSSGSAKGKGTRGNAASAQAAGLKGGGGGGGGGRWRGDRPAILVSSTSWTPDEDFGVLLGALVRYEAAVEAQQQQQQQQLKQQQGAPKEGTGSRGPPRSSSSSLLLPKLLVLITGRGPQREMYLSKVRDLKMRHVAVRSLWLESSDYPVLLGLADLGVSLHASSSGLDLPMKVVDMFGSGLPVCALSYPCIHELVEEGETGLTFDGPDQLFDRLGLLLRGLPSAPAPQLEHMRRQVAEKEQGLRWEENWDRVAWPVLGGGPTAAAKKTMGSGKKGKKV